MVWSEYEWKQEEKNLIQDLGLKLGGSLDGDGYVRRAENRDDMAISYAVKSIKKDSFEAKALQKMHALPSPRNITVPGRLLECPGTYLYLMPLLIDALMYSSRHINFHLLLQHLYSVIDFVQFMHENCVAYLDIKPDNMVTALSTVKTTYFTVPQNNLYFIDFGSARTLPSGPGSGITITDFNEAPGTYPPPEGRDIVDPYAYDIYALGYASINLLEIHKALSKKNPVHTPRCLWYFFETLKQQSPLNRPSIFRVRRQFTTLRIWIKCTSWTYKIFGVKLGDALGELGWKILSLFVR